MTVLTIYMKSGNKIRLPFVQAWNFKASGNDLTYLEITTSWLAMLLPGNRLIVSTIDMRQVEAVTHSIW